MEVKKTLLRMDILTSAYDYLLLAGPSVACCRFFFPSLPFLLLLLLLLPLLLLLSLALEGVGSIPPSLGSAFPPLI